MLNVKNNSMMVLSIVTLGFALTACGGSNPAAPSKPAAATSASKPSAADQAKALQNQAGAILNGDWSCIGDSCKVAEESLNSMDLKNSHYQVSDLQLTSLEISKDLTSFAQKETKHVLQANEDQNGDQGQEAPSSCHESIKNSLTVSNIQDNGNVAVITVQILSGETKHEEAMGDADFCDDVAFIESNPSADDRELEEKKSKAVTITLDRSKETLTIASVANSTSSSSELISTTGADGSTVKSKKKSVAAQTLVQVFIKK
jgi:hypothetical protein